MSGILIKDQKNETFEKGILRRVVRESWQTGAAKNSSDPKLAQALDDHATRMENLLNTFDYGALCMPNIIVNSKRMSYKELTAYLSYLEALGTGYKHWLNSESASIFLAGLTLKARDVHAATRYVDRFLSDMDRRLSIYGKNADKENASLDMLIAEFEAKNSGIFKFFRKGELSLLKSMIKLRSRRLRRFYKGKAKYSDIVVRVRGPRKTAPAHS